MARFGTQSGLHPQTAELLRRLAALHRPVTRADVERWSGKSGLSGVELVQRLRQRRLLVSLPLKGTYLVGAGHAKVDALSILRAWLALHGRDQCQLTEGAMRCESVSDLLNLPVIDIDVLARYSSDTLEWGQNEICRRGSRRGLVIPPYQVHRVKQLWRSRMIDGIPISTMTP